MKMEICMKLDSFYVEKPWGRTDLPEIFSGALGRKIGEIWFDAPDEPLPILVKWLFTSEKLSIQVHPNDKQAQSKGFISGKEECWIIISAEPDARLGMGTIRPLTPDELRSASLNGDIEQLMDWKPVKAGDYFYIPAGTVHAIGAGITLVEVQQNADVTYRLYDYGRPRELHLDDGVAVSVAKPYNHPLSGTVGADDVQMLVNGPHFDLSYARGKSIEELTRHSGKIWLIPLAGHISAGGEMVQAGECLLLENCPAVSATADAIALVALTHMAIAA
jgi:mannose-6-phosphate isomerase